MNGPLATCRWVKTFSPQSLKKLVVWKTSNPSISMIIPTYRPYLLNWPCVRNWKLCQSVNATIITGISLNYHRKYCSSSLCYYVESIDMNQSFLKTYNLNWKQCDGDPGGGYVRQEVGQERLHCVVSVPIITFQPTVSH